VKRSVRASGPHAGKNGDGPAEVQLDQPAPPIEVSGLISRFGDHVILDGLNLTVRRGEVLGVVGASGAGKTVLLKTLIGLKAPDGGTVKIFGQDIEKASAAEWDAIERNWGVMFQGGAMFSNLSVQENVEAAILERSNLPKSMASDIAWLKIALVGLSPDAGQLEPSELSGGMVKRASLARALALDPQLLFLDEPTTGLDPIAAAAFDRLLADLSAGLKLTVFMVTHDLDSLYAVCDRVAVIADKTVVAIGPVAEVAKSDHPWIQHYFGGSRGRGAALAAATNPHGTF
jgi:phospholipid/cholesterol/gamma-HCH transport system ATP-binding protein